jgi:hypothetical protein
VNGAAPLLIFVTTFLAIAGGGGSSSGDSGGSYAGSSYTPSNDSDLYTTGAQSTTLNPIGLVIILVVVAVFVILMVRFRAKAIKQPINAVVKPEVSQRLKAAAATDPTWLAEALIQNAKETFLKYQRDWSNFDTASMQSYMTPAYYQYNLLMMSALKLANRKNDVQNLIINSATVTNFVDSLDPTANSYSAHVSAKVRDVLLDTADGSELFAQNLSANETYRFQKSNNGWLFDGIDQSTARSDLRNVSLELFAKQNQLFYSLDWGHLLLPRRGQLFSSGSFGVSDINNHVIGMSGEMLIQIYNYVPNPGMGSRGYIIAQASIPKSYGNIVVRRKGENGSVGGLHKIETEWGEFNDRYDVYASDEEQATSFELLNPKFMEQLHSLSIPIAIEVVDSIIYLYSTQEGVVSADDYRTLLSTLKAVFKEMRM